MNTEQIKVKKLKENATLPHRATADSAGADLYACLDADVTIAPGGTEFIGTGIAMAIPSGRFGLVCARSGLASKKGLAPANKVGVIDSDYRGEIIVALHNHSGSPATVSHGERVAQLIIMQYDAFSYAEADALDDTDRGEGGFGSTGSR